MLLFQQETACFRVGLLTTIFIEGINHGYRLFKVAEPTVLRSPHVNFTAFSYAF